MRYLHRHKLIFKKSLFILFVFLASPELFAQTTMNVQGIIKSSTGQPLSGVLITIQESTVTSLTDENGEYSISAGVGDNLTFSLPGYLSSSKLVGEKISKIDVILTSLVFGQTEQDVVPIAYSTRNKRDLTSAISMTTYEEFGKRQDMNTMNGLGGLINGLIVMSVPWTDTGSDPTFIIRGLKTTNPNNSPLTLVDDVERNFGQLNANEIESISVLREPLHL